MCVVAFMFVGPCPHRERDYHIGSNFWKFYIIRTDFTSGELVFLVKVFGLFRLEWIFLVFGVWTQYIDVHHLIYWQYHRVCDALLNYGTTLLLFRSNISIDDQGHAWSSLDTIKLSVKSGKDGTGLRNPLFGLIGDEISENREEKYTGL